jgi:hypothetical protein
MTGSKIMPVFGEKVTTTQHQKIAQLQFKLNQEQVHAKAKLLALCPGTMFT